MPTKVASLVERLETRQLLSATTTVLSVSDSSTTYGQTETLTATISSTGGTPNDGTVTFYNGTTALGMGTVKNGTATFATTTLPVGVDVVTASYSGAASFAASSSTLSQSSLIETVAGIPLGYNGDNGPAAAARLGPPFSVAVDTAGNLFIADTSDNVIREVNGATHVITTVAGNGALGYSGYSGDNGAATLAQLNAPSGIAVDAAGDLFIADTGNNVIREVQGRTHVINTVAGNGTYGDSGDNGAATSAELNRPTSIAVDSSGNLFIADTNNSVIREVNATTQVINTVAGNGAQGYSGDNGAATVATLSGSEGIAVDSSGDLFIADTNNSVIREVNAMTQVITTVAGNGTAGYSGDNGAATTAELSFPSGIAVDSGGDLFVADTNNNVIREVNGVTHVINTVAGNGTHGDSGDNGAATAASLFDPEGIAVDSSGNLFIADTNNAAIREVKGTTDDITTVAGSGMAGYSGDNGSATAAKLNSPKGIAVDSSGALFIADTENNVIREVNGTTKVITTVAGNGSQGYSGDNGAATAAELNNPSSIAIDSSGDLFFEDGSTRIREVNGTTHIITTVAGNGISGYSGDNGAATAADVSNPEGIAVDSGGDLFIADTDNSVIREVNAMTRVITTVAGNGTYGYAGDNGAATNAKLSIPSGIAVDSAGDLFIADRGANVIREVNGTTHVITTIAGNGTRGYSGDGGAATAAELSIPYGMALDSAGDLFFADSGNSVIREMNVTTHIITTIAGNGASAYGGDNGAASAAELDASESIAFDSAGDLLIADTYNDRIREVATGLPINVIASLPDGVSVAKTLVNGNGVTYELSAVGDLYSEARLDTIWTQLDTGVTSIAIVGNDDVVDLHGDGGVYEFAGDNSNSSGVKLDAGVTSIAIAGNGDLIELSSSGVYEFTAFRSAGSIMKLDNSVTSFAIAGNGDVVELSNAGVYEFTAYRNASSIMKLDNSVTSFAIAGNGDVIELSNAGVYEFTAYRSAGSIMKLDNSVTSFAIAGNGDVIELSNAGLYEFTAYRSAGSIMKLDNSVSSFAIAGNGDVIELSNAGLYEFTAYRNAGSIMKLDNSVTSFAIAGNGDVMDLSNAGLYEFTAYRNAGSIMKLDNSVTSFAIAGNGDVMDLSAGGLYEFTAFRSASNVIKIGAGVTSFTIAGDDDVVALSAGVLYEFTAYRSASSYVQIDAGVTNFAIAGNGLVEDQRSSGNQYIQTIFDGPVSQLITQFI